MSVIAQRTRMVEERVAKAAAQSGRDPADIQIIAASKYADLAELSDAIDAGIDIFGENRAQELVRKSERTGESVHWHFIGHLQSNKVRMVVPRVDLIHSLDSVELAREVDKRAVGVPKVQDVLVEVNVSGEQTKHGVSPDELEGVLLKAAELDNLNVLGLMCMAPLGSELQSRQVFRELRDLAERASAKGLLPVSYELSMGMTNDFEIAIAEGATMIRIGSAIFKEDS